MDEPPLPDVHEGLLGTEELSAYLLDIETHAKRLTVIQKRQPTTYAEGQSIDLDGLRDLLASDSPPRLQLRYEFEGDGWFDTLVPSSAGVRLVRMRADF